MKVSGIFFDLDGTLVDSLCDIQGALNVVRARYGYAPHSPEFVRTHVGRGVENLIEGCFPERPVTDVPALVTEYRKYYLDNPSHGGKAYPGVADTLKVLQAIPGMKLGVVTNKTTLLAIKKVALYLPEIRFDIVAGPEVVSAHKPNARHLLDVLEKLGVAPNEAWMVGDDPVDRQCAEAAGTGFLAAVYGIGPVKGKDEAHTLRRFSDLLAKIPGLPQLPNASGGATELYKA